MSSNNLRNYDRLNEFFEQQGLLPSAAELQGMLSGMIASGAATEGEEWLLLMSDLANEGQKFQPQVKDQLNAMYDDVCGALADPDMSYQPLLPGDHEPLYERLQALTGWVQSFLVGFGVNQVNLASVSKDLREAIEDMVEIAKLDFEIEEEEEAEKAYFEILEYLRVSAILCFNELGQTSGNPCRTSKTLH
ncbi:MAG: UPF0149 family protein [Idiomarina sp.]